MINTYLAAWKRPFDFEGRSNRKEYWYFNIFSTLAVLLSNLSSQIFSTIAISQLDNSGLISNIFIVISQTIQIISGLFFLGCLWTSLPLSVRRIRDVGMSGLWIFLSVIPYFGNIFNLIFLTRTSIIDLDGKKYYPKY